MHCLALPLDVQRALQPPRGRPLGQKTIDGYLYLTDLSAHVYVTLRELVTPGRQGRWASLHVTLRQMLFTGVDALPVVSAIALMQLYRTSRFRWREEQQRLRRMRKRG